MSPLSNLLVLRRGFKVNLEVGPSGQSNGNRGQTTGLRWASTRGLVSAPLMKGRL